MSILNTFFTNEEMDAVFRVGKKVYFVGIGGVQMHALALLLSRMGYTVGGSDREAGAAAGRLRAAGIPVTVGHRPENIEGYDILVYTLAIAEDNPELLAARAAGMPCLSRANLLGYTMSRYPVRIAVAGMHGKSTTTAMLAAILQKVGLDPTVISGAPLCEGGAVFRLGGRSVILAEACEYKDSFLCLSPTVAVVLNVEHEHPDYFRDTAAVCRSFSSFLEGVPTVILPAARQPVALLPDPHGSVLRFGVEENAAVRAQNITYPRGCPAFDVVLRGVIRGRICLSIPGDHNMQNALAAAAVADVCGVPFPAIRAALSAFRGTPRRLERKGLFQGATVYLDYAHHPTEIRATLLTLRRQLCEATEGKRPAPGQRPARLFCLFQPHTYSRTAAFFCAFADALACADYTVLLDVYAAREENTTGIDAASLSAQLSSGRYANSMQSAAEALGDLCHSGDILVIMGAGDVPNILPLLGL